VLCQEEWCAPGNLGSKKEPAGSLHLSLDVFRSSWTLSLTFSTGDSRCCTSSVDRTERIETNTEQFRFFPLSTVRLVSTVCRLGLVQVLCRKYNTRRVHVPPLISAVLPSSRRAVCVCVCMCVHECARVHACVRVRVRVHVCASSHLWLDPAAKLLTRMCPIPPNR
jgi:hypothetical protein